MAKVFLDMGGHTGETVTAAVEARWAFDRIWTFEPSVRCLPALEAVADDRVEIVRAGLWTDDRELVLNDPGTVHASVAGAVPWTDETERCQFIDAAAWMAEHVDESDQVWAKVNIEGAEIEVLNRLLDTGELSKIDHLLVHFDAEKIGRDAEAAALRRRLDGSGVSWHDAAVVMFGPTVPAKVRSWLQLTHGPRGVYTATRAIFRVRLRIWQLRQRLGARR